MCFSSPFRLLVVLTVRYLMIQVKWCLVKDGNPYPEKSESDRISKNISAAFFTAVFDNIIECWNI
ncbi:hypothetical protein BBV17_06840 [Cytobacillus oceanisediminis]|uniref:Secreted protein n=1 Tax=Cytobacillus oceanisediminis TaxID=665099 RepID=A0ABX3CZ02_9BACI|nr:hypothetical protein BBV17_06840 [Cytobacillus oceanisediminis]